jgi:hypothetical protein
VLPKQYNIVTATQRLRQQHSVAMPIFLDRQAVLWLPQAENQAWHATSGTAFSVTTLMLLIFLEPIPFYPVIPRHYTKLIVQHKLSLQRHIYIRILLKRTSEW